MSDLTNKIFNHWVVLSYAGYHPGTRKKLWRCKCVCGNTKNVYQYSLTSGRSRSCGCRNGIDLSERRFGSLVAIMPVTRGDETRVWLCRCDCGTESLVRAQSLVEGHTKSCGCVGLEKKKETLKQERTKKAHSPSWRKHGETLNALAKERENLTSSIELVQWLQKMQALIRDLNRLSIDTFVEIKEKLKV